MSKDWDYAQRSHEMSVAGGPGVWVAKIKKEAFDQGASDTRSKLIPIITIMGIVICIGVSERVVRFIRKKKIQKSLLKQEAQISEELLLQECSKCKVESEEEK